MVNTRYNLKLRRRREGKTDYKKRLNMLRSRKMRLVIRASNTSVVVQVVEYSPDGDLIRAQASSAQLAALGWKHGTGNMPAAYLVGLLAGSRAKKAGVEEAIVDLGRQEPFHGGRLFAVVKGALDAGLAIPVSEDALPDEGRLVGAHIDEKIASSVEQIRKKVGA